MPPGFWAAYAVKLAIVGLVLGALYLLARKLRSMHFFAGSERRLIAVLESRALSPHASVHLLRVGRRYILVGSGNSGPRALAELDARDIEGERSADSVGPSHASPKHLETPRR